MKAPLKHRLQRAADAAVSPPPSLTGGQSHSGVTVPAAVRDLLRSAQHDRPLVSYAAFHTDAAIRTEVCTTCSSLLCATLHFTIFSCSCSQLFVGQMAMTKLKYFCIQQQQLLGEFFMSYFLIMHQVTVPIAIHCCRCPGSVQ